jgi:SsrA-binding protein
MSSRKVENKRARFDHEISETVEAGLVLRGSEIQAGRAGKVSLNGTFVRPLMSGPDGQPELWLLNAHFSGTEEPDRSRKLLVHRKEINRYLGKVHEKGLTLVPIEMYLVRGNVKVLVGLGKGKKQFEKRESIKERDVNRELRRGMK